MCTVHNEPIPIGKMRQFIEILDQTGGRFLNNPTLCEYEGTYRVDYKPGDYKAQREAWRRITTPIVEKRKDQLWRRIIRRIF